MAHNVLSIPTPPGALKRNALGPAYDQAAALFDAATALETLLDVYSRRRMTTVAMPPETIEYVAQRIAAATAALNGLVNALAAHVPAPVELRVPAEQEAA
jgi:hypothetical protein